METEQGELWSNGVDPKGKKPMIGTTSENQGDEVMAPVQRKQWKRQDCDQKNESRKLVTSRQVREDRST